MQFFSEKFKISVAIFHSSMILTDNSSRMQLNSLEDVSTTSQYVSNNTTTSEKVQNAEAGIEDQIAGYIFMCNAATKPDCFMYRVFGLPSSRMMVVEKMKPNTKLFLFDVDVKLLYGLYVATSGGKLALEPYAFGGKFPAQVKFSISRECLPLPEVAFKGVIKENYYSKFKFKQELNDEQVNKLDSLFCPMTVIPPQGPSLAFLDGVRAVYQKFMVPSQQDTSFPGVPRVAYAKSHYGQNSVPRCTMSPVLPAVAPPYSTLSSSLNASQWVAIAAEPLNAEVRTSSLTLPSSNVPVVSHAHTSYIGSNSGGVGYGYQDPAYPGSHQALSVTTDQGVNKSIHAYEMHPHYVRSYYTQNQRDLATPHTRVSGSSGVSVYNNAYIQHNSSNHPAPVSHGNYHTHGDPFLPQSLPSISSGVGAGNSYVHYNGANSATLAHAYGNTIVPTVQPAGNIPSRGSGMHQAYRTTAPPEYVNQNNYSSI